MAMWADECEDSRICDTIRDEVESLQAIYSDRLSVSYPTTRSSDLTVQCTMLIGGEMVVGDPSCSCKPTHRLLLSLVQGYPETASMLAKAVANTRATSTSIVALETVNKNLQSKIEELGVGDPCAFDVITWVTDAVTTLDDVGDDDDDDDNGCCISDDDHNNKHNNNGNSTDVQDELLLTQQQHQHQQGQQQQQQQPQLVRQWIYFIGFYTKSIRTAFCEAAADLGCTGFLMPGKPAVAAVEGTPKQIADFLYTTRTDLFAQVPPSMRKMTVSMLEQDNVERVFVGFVELVMHAAAGTHKRKDISDIAALQKMLEEKGVGRAFDFIFGSKSNS